jgi:hypothetical protein
LIALFELGSVYAILLLADLAAVFCANLSSLSKSDWLVNVYSSNHLNQTEEVQLQAATAQNVKTSKRLEIEARSSKLLIPFGFRLGICCSGLGLVRSALEALTPRTNAWTALRLAIITLLELSKRAPARSIFATHPEYRNLLLCASSVCFLSAATALRLPESINSAAEAQPLACGERWKSRKRQCPRARVESPHHGSF